MDDEIPSFLKDGKERLDRANDDHEVRHATSTSLAGAIMFVQKNYGPDFARPLVLLLAALEDLDKGRRPAMFAPLAKPHRPPSGNDQNALKATATALVDYATNQSHDLKSTLDRVGRKFGLRSSGLASFRKKLHAVRSRRSVEKHWMQAIEVYEGVTAALMDNRITIEQALDDLRPLLTHPAQKSS